MACPKELEAKTREGVELAKNGNFEEAFKLFNEVLEIDPKCVHTITNKAIAMHNYGEFLINKALEINPEFSEALEAKKLFPLNAT